MKKFIPILNNEKYTHIDARMSYDKEKKAYYLSFAAVKIERGFVAFELFSSPYKRYILETVNRQSKKAAERVEAEAVRDFDIYLSHFAKCHNLTIEQ